MSRIAFFFEQSSPKLPKWQKKSSSVMAKLMAMAHRDCGSNLLKYVGLKICICLFIKKKYF